MLAALLSKIAAWLGGRGLRILVREIADALEEAEKARDYKAALIENAQLEAEARDLAGQNETRKRMQDAKAFDPDPDPDALRQWLRDRDPKTK